MVPAELLHISDKGPGDHAYEGALPGAGRVLNTAELMAGAVSLGKGSVKAAAVACFREGFRTRVVKAPGPRPHGFRAPCTCHGLRDLGPQSMSPSCHTADRDVTGPSQLPYSPRRQPGPYFLPHTSDTSDPRLFSLLH